MSAGYAEAMAALAWIAKVSQWEHPSMTSVAYAMAIMPVLDVMALSTVAR